MPSFQLKELKENLKKTMMKKKDMLNMVKDIVAYIKDDGIAATKSSDVTFSDKYLLLALQRVLIKNTRRDLVDGV